MFFLATSSLQETFNGLTCEIKCDSGTDLLNMQLFLDLKGAHEMSKKWGSESKDKIPCYKLHTTPNPLLRIVKGALRNVCVPGSIPQKY